jgi:hypothetical protein
VSTPWSGGPAPFRSPAVYSGQFPAGLDAIELPRVPRPPVLVVALLLQMFSGLPFVLVGGVVLDGVDGLAAADGQLVGGLLVGAGLVFCGLAAIAFAGWNWARMVLGVLTGSLAVLLLVVLVNGTIAMPAGRAAILVILATAVAAALLMFLPGCAQFFANPRPVSRQPAGRL